jgi:hypothetical protein
MIGNRKQIFGGDMHLRSLAPAMTILAAACGYAATAGAAPAPAAAERLLAQEGLAVALASTMLLSQLEIILATLSQPKNACADFLGGGSAKLIEVTRKKSEVESVVDLYYDAHCAKPFITADLHLTSTHSFKLPANITATYTGPNGSKLGTLSLDETFVISDKGVRFVATGSFVPATGGAAVSLGLICSVPPGSKTAIAQHCQVGIAQDFPALKLALASITPIQRVVQVAGNTYTVSFTGSGSLVMGEVGKLSIIAASPKHLGIMGASEADGTTRLAGTAAEYALFPPMPTGWTVTDKAAGAKFSIHVASDTLRNSVGTITKIAKGTPLASFAVDQSGTGTIDYSDGTRAAVTAWILSD